MILGLAVASAQLPPTPGGEIELAGVAPSASILVLGDQNMVVEVGGVVRYTLPAGVLTPDETLSNGVGYLLTSRPTLSPTGERVIFKTFSRQAPGTQLWGANYSWELATGKLLKVAQRGDTLRFPPASQPDAPPASWGMLRLVWSSHPEWGWDDQSAIFHGPTYILRSAGGKLHRIGYPDGGWFLPGLGLVEIRGFFVVSAYRVVGNLPEGNILEVGPLLSPTRIFPHPLKGGYWQFERTASGELRARSVSAGVPRWTNPQTTLRWTGAEWQEVVAPQPPPPPPPPPPPVAPSAPPVTPLPPPPTIGAVVNGADASRPLTPGAVGVLYGTNLQEATLLLEWKEVEEEFWHSQTQINFRVPLDFGPGEIRVEVRLGAQSTVMNLVLAPSQ